jgi:hypothetical protein
MTALRNGSKCSHTMCMLRFFTASRFALDPNLIIEISSNNSWLTNCGGLYKRISIILK